MATGGSTEESPGPSFPGTRSSNHEPKPSVRWPALESHCSLGIDFLQSSPTADERDPGTTQGSKAEKELLGGTVELLVTGITGSGCLIGLEVRRSGSRVSPEKSFTLLALCDFAQGLTPNRCLEMAKPH